MFIAVYLRISRDPLKLQAGVGRQRADCTAIATARWSGYETREYVDNDVSASRYSRHRVRPMFQQLCEDIKAGSVFAVVGWNFDRLFRQPRELETFLDLCDGLQFTRAVTAQGDVDLTTDDGRLHARIMVAVAAKESDDKSRRIRRSAQDRRENGQHHGGRVVYGYSMVDGTPTIDHRAAKQVREVAEAVLSGLSLRAVSRELQLRGCGGLAPTTGSGIKKMLLSPTLIARTSSGARGTWEPILSDRQHADLRALLMSPHRQSTAPSGRRSWWLTGLVVCGVCHHRMQIKRDSDGACSYACKKLDGGCGGVAIRARKLQWHMETVLFSFVVGMERTANVDDVVDAACAEVGTEDRLAELAALYATGGIGRAEWEAARKAVIPIQLPAPSTFLRPVADLPARWEKLTADQQHQHASRLIESVTIHRRVRGGAKWQTDRIKVRWLQ